jgi:hypothetical protein
VIEDKNRCVNVPGFISAYFRGQEGDEEQSPGARAMEGTSRADVLMDNVMSSKWL